MSLDGGRRLRSQLQPQRADHPENRLERGSTVVGSALSDHSPLAGLNDLERLDLSNNAIRDIEPLLANSGLGASDTVYLHGNPLNAESIETHIPALRDWGVSVYHIDLSIMAASAHEGESLEFTVRLSLPASRMRLLLDEFRTNNWNRTKQAFPRTTGRSNLPWPEWLFWHVDVGVDQRRQ